MLATANLGVYDVRVSTNMQAADGEPGGASGARRPSRREEILDAVAPLFARHGFHGVSIEDLGGAAGMSGPALYRHFPSKEQMLAQMLLRISERLLDEGSRRVSSAADASSALDALLRWHIEFSLEHPALITVHDSELGNVPAAERRRVRRLQRRYVEEWVTVLSELLPEVSQQRLRAATHAMFGLLNSTPHSAGELDSHAMADLLYRMARAALLSPRAAPNTA